MKAIKYDNAQYSNSKEAPMKWVSNYAKNKGFEHYENNQKHRVLCEDFAESVKKFLEDEEKFMEDFKGRGTVLKELIYGEI